MKITENVLGYQVTRPKIIEFHIDTVYVRRNIRQIERVLRNTEIKVDAWIYDETQYDLKEFHEFIAENSETIERLQLETLDYTTNIDMRLAILELGI